MRRIERFDFRILLEAGSTCTQTLETRLHANRGVVMENRVNWGKRRSASISNIFTHKIAIT